MTDTHQRTDWRPSEGVTDSSGLGPCGQRRFLALASKSFGGAFAWHLDLELRAVARRREADSSL